MLIQLYSETDLFEKSFVFQSGINIILGEYSDDKETKGINGIGKSSLVRLIDYALLSKSAEKRFSQPKYDFLREEKHNIILEFTSNNKNYLIKRTFRANEIVLFGEAKSLLEEYTKEELRKILANIFFPFKTNDTFFQGERYGTLMDFFIKDDLESQQRVDPLKFSQGTQSQINKAVFNFYLMGLPTRDILKYDEVLTEHNSLNDTSKGLENKIRIDQGKSIEEFKSERIKIEQNINLLEQSLKDYKFLQNYKNIESELISLTSKINDQLKEYYSLNRKLKKIKESFHINNSVDIDEIQKIYKEINITFGAIVTKSLEDLITFRKEILENRNKFLYSKESEIQSAISKILNDISVLEEERSELYKMLEAKGALDSLTNTFEQLTIEKTQLAGNLRILEELDSLQEMKSNLQVTISEIKRDILNGIKENEQSIHGLRQLFLEILQNAIYLDSDNVNGHFDISSKADSPRNQLPFKIEIEIPKADALGQSRLKIVVYDLMIFLKNIKDKRALPDFLIHDGVFHGVALNTKVKALNYLYHQHLANPYFQYFITFNEDEIYIPDEKKQQVGGFDFKLTDVIIAKFSDRQEDMLFKRDFK